MADGETGIATPLTNPSYDTQYCKMIDEDRTKLQCIMQNFQHNHIKFNLEQNMKTK